MTDNLAPVPPRRLGTLLHDARDARSLGLDQLAASSRFSVEELRTVEAGEHELTDPDLADVLAVYGVEPGELVPERSRLVIDLREHRLVAGGEARALADPPTPDEVLAAYLSLLYTLRHLDPGTPLTLRDADVQVLARALELTGPAVEERLGELMAEPAGEVHRRTGLLRAKVLVPVAGVVVAVTAAGALILVTHDDDSSSPPATVEAPAPESSTVVGPGVSLAPPLVATRNADGSVTQTERAPDPNAPLPPDSVVVQEGLPADALAPGQVGLAPAQVATRNADGSVTQTDRQPDESASTTTTSTG